MSRFIKLSQVRSKWHRALLARTATATQLYRALQSELLLPCRSTITQRQWAIVEEAQQHAIPLIEPACIILLSSMDNSHGAKAAESLLQKLDFAPTSSTQGFYITNWLMDLRARTGDIQSVESMYQKLKTNWKPNEYSAGALVTSYSYGEGASAAEAKLHEIESQSKELVNWMMYLTVFEAWMREKRYDEAIRVWQEFSTTKHPVREALNRVIAQLVHAHQIDRARSLQRGFDEIYSGRKMVGHDLALAWLQYNYGWLTKNSITDEMRKYGEKWRRRIVWQLQEQKPRIGVKFHRVRLAVFATTGDVSLTEKEFFALKRENSVYNLRGFGLLGYALRKKGDAEGLTRLQKAVKPTLLAEEWEDFCEELEQIKLKYPIG